MLHLFTVNVPSKDVNILYSPNNQFNLYWQKRRQTTLSNSNDTKYNIHCSVFFSILVSQTHG